MIIYFISNRSISILYPIMQNKWLDYLQPCFLLFPEEGLIHYENHLYMFYVEMLESGRSALPVMAGSGFWRSDSRLLRHNSMTEEVQ